MEERKRRRVLFQKDVIVNGALKTYSLDISEAGMYLHTPAEFMRDAVLDLAFDIKGYPVTLKASIQHMESGIGIGVKFLNLQQSPDSAMLVNAIVSQQRPPVSKLEARKVLLIDSNDTTRSIYKSRLTQDGFNVLEAEKGIEAFKTILLERPDIIVVDPRIEGLDGFKLLQLMRINPELKRIPVIVISSRLVPEEIDKAISLGAKEYLVKNTTTPKKLTETVRQFLKV